MTTALISGANALLQNVVYATPGAARWCVSDTELEVSTTVGGTFTAVPETVTGVVLGGGLFVRCPTGAAVVVLSSGSGLFGGDSASSRVVNVVWNSGAAPTPLNGVALVLDISTVGAVAEAYGINSSVVLSSALAVDVAALVGSVTVLDPGESDNIYGLQAALFNAGTGVVGAAYGVYVSVDQANPGGITTTYGFYCAALSGDDIFSFFAELGAGIASFTDGVKTGVFGVGSLPTPSAAIQGLRLMVNNANATTFASIVAAGGANIVPVYCDGTNWRIG